MPKLIKHFPAVELKAVEKVSDKDDANWKWREGYIGYQGELYIMESTHKFPGKQYLYFTDHGRNWITTGYGKIVVRDKMVCITTPNSVYYFEILSDGGE